MKAVIFDMDGIIIDSEKISFLVIKDVLESHGYSLSEEYFRNRFVGNKIKATLKVFLEEEKNPPSITSMTKEYIEHKREFLANNLNSTIFPRAGVVDCIKRTYKSFALGLKTSTRKELAHTILRQFNLAFYFNSLIFGEDVHESKPNPESYFLCSQRLHIPPHNIVVIVDSEKGVLAAKEAQMKVIAVPNEFTKNQNFSKANIVLKNFDTITEKLILSL